MLAPQRGALLPRTCLNQLMYMLAYTVVVSFYEYEVLIFRQHLIEFPILRDKNCIVMLHVTIFGASVLLAHVQTAE